MFEPGRLQATSPERLVAWCRSLMFLNGAFWIGAGLWTVQSFGSRSGDIPVAILVGLMFGNAAFLFGLAYRLRGLGPSVLIAAPLWIAVNLVLSFTDEIGLPDLMVGLLNLVTLVLLLVLGAVWWRRRKER